MRILAAYLPALTEPPTPAQLDSMLLGLHAFGPTVDVPAQADTARRSRNQPDVPPQADIARRSRNQPDVPAQADIARPRFIVLLDVTGCSGLFGKPMARGEAVLAHKVRAFFESLGLAAHVAIAEGPRLAAMFAQLAHNPIVVAKDHTMQALSEVPLSLLPLTPSELDYFLKLGFATAGDLMALPSASLGARFERRKKDASQPASRAVAGPEDLLLLLRGEDRAPLRAHVRNDPPEAAVDLAYPTASTEALSFVLKNLCDTLWCSMQGLSLRKVSVRLRIDRGERAREIAFSSTFAPALGNREDVLSALRAKLERTFTTTTGASESATDDLIEVQRVGVRFDETVPSVLANLSLYSSEARAARALPKLLAELREGLGEERVGRLAVADTWNMNARSVLSPPASWQPCSESALNVVEPTRLVAALPIDDRAFEPMRLILRLERDDWFSTGSARREIQMAWYQERSVCIERSGPRTTLLGYFD